MARRSWNPIGFSPYVVTFFTVVIYTGLLAALIVTHHVLPPAPSHPTPKQWSGVNLTTAWHDLEHLSSEFHPFNSRSNVAVRNWLLGRVGQILDGNNAQWKEADAEDNNTSIITVFDKDMSNVTYTDDRGFTVYYESTNIMVYLRGEQDPDEEWWKTSKDYKGPGGVMVNAHFDSVSTGYGATDDGMGVISVLQLLSHFSQKDNRPQRGILFLLNNGEEDGLYGARAFTQHPLSKFPRTFLNLEGAGAGGRATLFRSTDAEVTRFYANSPYPFGSVISGDGFKRGLIRSGTDYSVFTEQLGMRGLDVAFMEPRARYHTSQDDARDTSVQSLWHMLSASLETVKGLSDDTSSQFERSDDGRHEKTGSVGVWFDMFGQAFAVLQLHTMFAWSVTLLVAGPVLLIFFDFILHKTDKWYLFSRKKYLHSSDDDEPIKFFGWRGFFRFPLVFIAASGVVVVLAYLMEKINPLISYSSEYAVWSMMLASWISVAWFFLRLGDAVRPSALTRAYTLIWLYALSWIALVAATIGEHRMKLGSGYFIIVYNASIFVALLISYLEFFALPKKSAYVDQVTYAPGTGYASPARTASVLSNHADQEEVPRGRPAPTSANDNDDANERTSLLNQRQTFARYGRDRRRSEDNDTAASVHIAPKSEPYEGEQLWSSSLPRWTWFFQFLILAPINIILIGQIGLLITSALHQTTADGSSSLLIYILIAAISVLLLLPLTPFIHRISYQVPTFIFFIAVGTLIYNLTAFPFSRSAKLKVFFIQQIDLDNGTTTTALTGLSPYLESIVSKLPSANTHQSYQCGGANVDWAHRRGLDTCSWSGLSPSVVPDSYVSKPPGSHYPNTTTVATANGVTHSSINLLRRQQKMSKYVSWIDFNVTRMEDSDTFRFEIQGKNTRSCRIYFETPFKNLTVASSGSGAKTVPLGKQEGEQRVYLYKREWDGKWSVDVSFEGIEGSVDATKKDKAGKDKTGKDGDKNKDGKDKDGKHEKDKRPEIGVQGKVLCVWSDVNQVGLIPAFDEVKRFMPVWSAVTKNGDGLVEGYRGFRI